MNNTIITLAGKYVGKQETHGSNEGPNIQAWKRMLGPGVASAPGISWCAIFVTAMLVSLNRLDRRQLCARLGFRPGKTYFESCDSWVSEILAHDASVVAAGNPEKCYLVTDPRPGDIFFLMEFDGSHFSTTKAHHTGIVQSSLVSQVFNTVEANTDPGTAEGRASRNGDGVYFRSRANTPGRFLFARLHGLTGL